MRRRRLLLLAGPLRLRGEPSSRGAAEGGGDAGRLCKVWEENEASGRPGSVRGRAGLNGPERGLGAAPRPGPACAEDDRAAAASTPSSPPPPPQELLTGEAEGGQPGPGGALTAPSEEEVCALAAPESQTQKPPATPALGRARDVAQPRGFPALRSLAPRGDGLQGAGAAASSRGASRRRRRLAPRLGSAPTARARLSLRAGARGFAARAAGAGSARRGAAPPRAPPWSSRPEEPGPAAEAPRRASVKKARLRTSSEAAAGVLAASQPGI
ncbi:tropomyosin-1, isoforms 33/34-like [Dasypus novemcinctus]|uniref:tropomyosin-1, isoforms 33/34-like n=1 Tax=Dasypus novemcinctus TaxID=9361 RepID=UPI0039C978C9